MACFYREIYNTHHGSSVEDNAIFLIVYQVCMFVHMYVFAIMSLTVCMILFQYINQSMIWHRVEVANEGICVFVHIFL